MDNNTPVNEQTPESTVQVSRKIPRNVFMLGLVSFFNDVASEMIYPVIPIFLTAVLGAPVAVVGIIEGIAESSSSFFKLYFGRISDKAQKRKSFVTAGYSLTAVSRLILAAAFTWPLVLLGRFFDRLGKGVRTSARDALIAESAPPEIRGKAFGFHRAMDTTGAVLGPLLSILLIQMFNANAVPQNLRNLFLIAFIPSVIGVILLVLLVKEQHKQQLTKEEHKFRWADFGTPFKVFILVSVIFSIGNSSDAFLILRAKNFGLSTTDAILCYVLFNTTYAILSTPFGIVADKIGPRKVLITGFVLFSGIYLLFGFVSHQVFIWLLFAAYGIYMALTEGVGKAYISNQIAREKLGTAFGIYYFATGIATFLASAVAGYLWTYVHPSAPFIYGGSLALLAVIVFILIKPGQTKENGQIVTQG